MRAKLLFLSLAILLATGIAAAQSASRKPTTADIYCSGMVTVEKVARDAYLISGEQSNYKFTFAEGDIVYINRGSGQGVKVGDEFLVMRPVKDALELPWAKWQNRLLRAMGTEYADLGRLRVIHVQPNVAIAQIAASCNYMQRGDIVQPFVERPVPEVREATNFDHFAPLSGKSVGMVVQTMNFGQLAGMHSIAYVNLGAGQSVKVGDYIRIFRYQSVNPETAYQTAGMAHKTWGFGSTPTRYKWDDLPREILGEGVVLRTTPNASTVLITFSLREVYAGDYIEIQ